LAEFAQFSLGRLDIGLPNAYYAGISAAIDDQWKANWYYPAGRGAHQDDIIRAQGFDEQPESYGNFKETGSLL
jgi:hypothetical protein